MATHPMHIAGLDRDLPICKVTDDLYIGAFIMFGDAELTVRCAEELLKLAGGLVLVVGVKSVLKAPLYALMGADGDAVRYGVMILTAGVLWPLTFRWFGRLGKKQADTLQ